MSGGIRYKTHSERRCIHYKNKNKSYCLLLFNPVGKGGTIKNEENYFFHKTVSCACVCVCLCLLHRLQLVQVVFMVKTDQELPYKSMRQDVVSPILYLSDTETTLPRKYNSQQRHPDHQGSQKLNGANNNATMQFVKDFISISLLVTI